MTHYDTAHNDVMVVTGDDDGLEVEYDSDCFVTPPLPPSRSISSVVPPLCIETTTHDDAPSQDDDPHRVNSSPRSRGQSPAAVSEDGSVFSLGGPDQEPEPVIEVKPKRRRGRPPKKKQFSERAMEVVDERPTTPPLALHDLSVVEDGLAKYRGMFEEVYEVEATGDIEAAVSDNEVEEEAKGKSKKTQKEALIPDFIIEPPDDAMFAELRAFLDREEERNVSESSEERDGEGRDEDEDLYEERRRRKLQANREILLKLGLAPPSSGSPVLEERQDDGREEEAQKDEKKGENEETERRQQLPQKHASTKRGGQGMPRQVRVDTDGTTTSNPPAGLTFEVAYVDLPVLRNRTRLQHIFCDDVPALAPLTANEEDVGQEWIDDSSEEDERPGKRRRRKSHRDEDGALVHVPKRRQLGERLKGPRGEAVEGAGTTCHQCRRKTEEPKMRCRHHEQGRVCTLYWCRRCLDIRYAIDFDEDSRTFECPRCLAYCNCSLCLHRAGLKHFVPQSINSGLSGVLYSQDGERIYSSVKHYIEEKVGRAVKIGPGGLPKAVGKREDPTSETAKAKEAKKVLAKATRVKKRLERESAKQMSASMRKVEREAKRQKKAMEKQKKKQRAVPKKGAIKKIILKVNRPKSDDGGTHEPESGEVKESAAARRRRRAEAKSEMQTRQLRMATTLDETRRAPTKRGHKADKAPQNATVWVKSRADAVDSSDDEDLDDVSTLSSLEDEEGLLEDPSSVDSSDDENDGDEEGGEEDVEAPSSPPVGHVEYWHPPLACFPQDRPSSPMRSAQSSREPDHTYTLGDTHPYLAGYPVHSKHELAVIMSQLRESGLA